MKRALSPAEVARRRTEIVRLCRRGLSLAAIGESFGLTKQRVHQIIESAAPGLAGVGRIERREEEAERRAGIAVRPDLSRAEQARLVGCSLSAWSDWLSAHGLADRPGRPISSRRRAA